MLLSKRTRMTILGNYMLVHRPAASAYWARGLYYIVHGLRPSPLSLRHKNINKHSLGFEEVWHLGIALHLIESYIGIFVVD